jgi:predicted nucleic acid-binding protein
MSRIVVADAGPLIALARIGRIELLRLLYGGAVVPVAVMEELQLDSRRPGADTLRAARNAGWLEVMTAPTDVHALKQVLDPGEAEAMPLLLARNRGIPVVGTAGLPLPAHRRTPWHLDDVPPEMQAELVEMTWLDDDRLLTIADSTMPDEDQQRMAELSNHEGLAPASGYEAPAS